MKHSLFTYLKNHINRFGVKLIYSVLLLYYAFRNSDTPGWAKHIITGAFAYLISPIDSIPDLTPFIGFTDDLSVLAFALVGIACYINSDIRDKARNDLSGWVKNFDEKILDEVDGVL